MSGNVTVEFFGMPRQQAGCTELIVAAGTLGEVMAAVEQACPGLRGLVQSDGGLTPHYLLAIDGHRFVSNLQHRVAAGQRVLLLSADAGG